MRTSNPGRGNDYRFVFAFFALEQRPTEGRGWFLRRRDRHGDRRSDEKDYSFRLAVADHREAGVGKRAAKELVRNRAGTRFKRRRRHGRPV